MITSLYWQENLNLIMSLAHENELADWETRV